MTPPPDTDLLLDVTGLRTTFQLPSGRDATAVDDVSFQIRRGETLGLVGESGSGKSVTALSLVGLVAAPGRVAAGQVLFEGTDLARLDDPALCRIRGRRIGFVFQEPMVALDPVYTIGAQIRETLRAHGFGADAAARVKTLLEAVRIPDAARRAAEYPHQLSGGLRQRVMLALALAAEPSLLIADEPTTALDVTVQAEILELLADLRTTRRLSVLLITHDLGVVARMADRVAVMYAGRIVEVGRTRDVIDTPAHPYTRALLASMPGASAGPRLRAIPGQVPPLGERPIGCGFAARCAERLAACDARPRPVTLAGAHDVACFLRGSTPA